jgi:hypothetical protein
VSKQVLTNVQVTCTVDDFLQGMCTNKSFTAINLELKRALQIVNYTLLAHYIHAFVGIPLVYGEVLFAAGCAKEGLVHLVAIFAFKRYPWHLKIS